MQRYRPLLHRYTAWFLGISIITLLLFGRPIVPKPCFSDLSKKVDPSNITLRNEAAASFDFYYSRIFQEEELLWFSKGQADESYRLLFDPSFWPIQLVHVWKTGNEYFISLKRSRVVAKQTGKGTVYEHKLDKIRQSPIKQSEWRELKRLIDVTCYWGTIPSISHSGKDGESFMLEGRRGDRYHAVDRWEPSSISYYRRLCNYLLKLAKKYS